MGCVGPTRREGRHIVFSLDSVITAVGLVEHVSIMAIAIILGVAVMLIAAKAIGDFVDEHPTIKIAFVSDLSGCHTYG